MQNINNLISLLQSSKRTLFILCGYPYSGKSYVARQIVSDTDIELISIDSLFESKGFSWDNNNLPNAQEWDKIFSLSYELVTRALQAGKSVLYDSTNHTVASRDKLRALANDSNAECRVIYVKAATEIIWQRWEENNLNPTRSKVSKVLVQQTIDAFEEPPESEGVTVIEN